MPFEQRDFVQSDLAQMFELIPVDFALGVSAEHTAHTIVRDTLFDGNVPHCAVDKRSQKKLGGGFGAFCISVVPLAALGRRRTAVVIRAAIPFSSQIEVNILLSNPQMPQR